VVHAMRVRSHNLLLNGCGDVKCSTCEVRNNVTKGVLKIKTVNHITVSSILPRPPNSRASEFRTTCDGINVWGWCVPNDERFVTLEVYGFVFEVGGSQ
jgi:hypothetical protein